MTFCWNSSETSTGDTVTLVSDSSVLDEVRYRFLPLPVCLGFSVRVSSTVRYESRAGRKVFMAWTVTTMIRQKRSDFEASVSLAGLKVAVTYDER